MAISKDGADCMISVQTKQHRDRDTIVKKFNKEMARILHSGSYTPELSLRILRSFRLKLLHQYCKNVLEEVHIDAIRVQAVQTCNQLRAKAALMPQSDGRLFTLGKGSVMENISCYAE